MTPQTAFFIPKKSRLMDIDQIKIHFDPSQMTMLNVCLAFLMFGVALDIRVSDFGAVFRQPRVPLVGLFTQIFLFPLLTLGLVYIFRPPVSVALGMVLVSACPSGNMSNFATHLAKGNVALSVTLTSLLTLAAIVTTPLSFALCAQFVPGAAEFQKEITIDPLAMVKIIIQLILLPLLVGIFLQKQFPNFVHKIKKPISILSLLIFAAFIVGALVGNAANISQHLGKVFFIVLVHNSAALALGYYFARSWGIGIRDARTLAIESGIHNTGLGLILVFNFFNGIGGMAMVAAWWGIWDMIAVSALAIWWGSHSQKA